MVLIQWQREFLGGCVSIARSRTRAARLVYPLVAIVLSAMDGWAQPKEAPPDDAGSLVYAGEPLKLPLDCSPQTFYESRAVCSERTPCDVYAEMVGIAAAGKHLVIYGNYHTASDTIATLLLTSDDDGKSWREPVERIGAAAFEFIQFVDADHGWVVGSQSQIDGSERPVILVTENGGAYWEKRPLWDADSERTGIVEKFYFEDASHGFLVVDREGSADDPYELYESRNGGKSWGFRQTSAEPISLRQPRPMPEQENWRLADGSSDDGYAVQRKVNGEWSTVAEFNADLGTCTELKEAEKPEDKVTQAPTEPKPLEAVETLQIKRR